MNNTLLFYITYVVVNLTSFKIYLYKTNLKFRLRKIKKKEKSNALNNFIFKLQF